MANSTTEAKAVTGFLLQKVKPYMEDAAGLMTLGHFLPIALQALDGIDLSSASDTELSVLRLYKSTCDKLTEAIKKNEDSSDRRRRVWKDVTIDGKSWFDYLTIMQSCILVFQQYTRDARKPLSQYSTPSQHNHDAHSLRLITTTRPVAPLPPLRLPSPPSSPPPPYSQSPY
jgi:hypothetical protein